MNVCIYYLRGLSTASFEIVACLALSLISGFESHFGADDSLNDRLQQPKYHKLWGGSLNSSYTRQIYYEYNGTSRVAAMYSQSGELDLGLWRSSSTGDYDSWDRFGRTITQKWQRTGSTLLDQVDYTYDFAVNRLTRDIPTSLSNGFDQVYSYDGLQRLATYDDGTISGGSISSPDFERDWTLDQQGNWGTLVEKTNGSTDFTQTRTHNEANELGTISNWQNPAHDAAGNMTTIPQPASLSSSYTLVYDAWNRLILVKDGSTVVQKNKYDGLHRRIIRDSDDNAGNGNERHFYYNNQWQVLSEFVGSTADAIYSYHPQYIDAVAQRMRDSGAHSVHTHFFLHDANYNVTAAVDATSGSGNYRSVVERYAYTPYGEVTVLDANFSADGDGVSDIANEFLYTGRRLDPETRLQLNRNRFYHQQLGRWSSRDPIGYEGSQWNLYEFVFSSPLRWGDPFRFGADIIIGPPPGTGDPIEEGFAKIIGRPGVDGIHVDGIDDAVDKINVSSQPLAAA